MYILPEQLKLYTNIVHKFILFSISAETVLTKPIFLIAKNITDFFLQDSSEFPGAPLGYCIFSFAIHLMEKIHSHNCNRWISYFSCGRNFTSITCSGEILSIKILHNTTLHFTYKIIYKLVTVIYIVEFFSLFFSSNIT